MIRPISLHFVDKDNLGIYDTPLIILYKVDFLLFYFFPIEPIWDLVPNFQV